MSHYSLGEAIDHLIIANIKLTKFETMIYEENKKPEEERDLLKIARSVKDSRAANERRAVCRDIINEIFADASDTEFVSVTRTFK